MRVGHPLQWLKTVDKDLNSINVKLEEAIKIAEDRENFKCLVCRVRAQSITDKYPELKEELAED